MTQKEQKWLVLLRCLSELNGGAQRSVVLQYINDQGYWCKMTKTTLCAVPGMKWPGVTTFPLSGSI